MCAVWSGRSVLTFHVMPLPPPPTVNMEAAESPDSWYTSTTPHVTSQKTAISSWTRCIQILYIVRIICCIIVQHLYTPPHPQFPWDTPVAPFPIKITTGHTIFSPTKVHSLVFRYSALHYLVNQMTYKTV
jgi:hypothetical protein